MQILWTHTNFVIWGGGGGGDIVGFHIYLALRNIEFKQLWVNDLHSDIDFVSIQPNEHPNTNLYPVSSKSTR